MKKYLLTALLGVFGLFGAFASADTVCTSDGFTSQNVNLSVSSDSDSIEVNGITYYEYATSMFDYCENGCYILINSTSPTIQYYGDGRTEGSYFPVSSFPVVYDATSEGALDSFYLYSSTEGESVSGNFSFSTSPIACEGNAGTESDDNPSFYPVGGILSGGKDSLKPILNGLEGTMMEFIPYIAYIGLGIIVACLGFVAIRRLVNWVRAKIFDNF